MGHFRKQRTMFRSMFLFVSALILSTVLIFDVLIMTGSWRTENAKLVETSGRISAKLQTAVTAYMEQTDALLSSMKYDLLDDSRGYVYKLFSAEPYASNAEQIRVNHYLTNFFAKMGLMQSDLETVHIYIGNEKEYYWSRSAHRLPNSGAKDAEWIRNAIELDGQTYTRINYVPEGTTYGRKVIGFSRKLKNLSNIEISSDSVILFEYSISTIDDIVERYVDNASDIVLFINSSGEVVYQYGGQHDITDGSGFLQTLGERRITRIGGGTYCLASADEDVQGYRIIVLSDYYEFMESFKHYILTSLFLAAGMILLVMIPAYFYVRHLCMEVEKLEDGLRRLCGGDFSIRLESRRQDEIGSLVRSFNDMAGKTQTLIRRQYQQEIEKREAEYKYLQAQVDPHFIFNSLQVISSIAIVKGIESIESVAGSLARILSYSLSSQSKEITIEEELGNVRQYMNIQQVRFRDRITFETDVSPEILHFRIIKMVLQPIVENAISHGLEPRGGSGTIRIHGFKRGNGCLLMVCDDGNGMDSEQLRLLRDFINGDDSTGFRTKGHGVGLRNIHNRLKLYYGEEYGLKIESEPGVGTTVVVQTAFADGGKEEC